MGTELDTRRDLVFSLVVYCAWRLSRAIMISDLFRFVQGSQKLLRADLKHHEQQGRLIKTSIAYKRTKRKRIAWVPVNRAFSEESVVDPAGRLETCEVARWFWCLRNTPCAVTV